MIRYLRGYCRIRICGAEPLRTVNLFVRRRIGFWKLDRPDELTVECFIYKIDLPVATQYATQTMSTVHLLSEQSASKTFGGLQKRPVLLVGVLLAVLLAAVLQHFVWTVQIEGNEAIPTEQLRQQLEEVGVRFGAWGPSLKQQRLKFLMVNRVGKLAWIGINRNGCKVTVSVTEREEDATDLDRRVFTNLVAVRPGIITCTDIYNGFAAVQTGDAVVTGQLLVSGMADWPTHTQITCAMGEIFAMTLHQKDFGIPETTAKKCYTGREYRQVSVVLGRKRIKLSGSSGIFYPSCDKMIIRKICTLPGGYTFPLILETVVYKEYTLTAEPLAEQTARQTLTAYSETYLCGETVAGTILSRADSFTRENGVYRLNASVIMEEMIARSRAGALEESNGTNHQRRAN